MIKEYPPKLTDDQVVKGMERKLAGGLLVGDRVAYSVQFLEALEFSELRSSGTVIEVHDGWAVVRWDERESKSTVPIANLILVEEE